MSFTMHALHFHGFNYHSSEFAEILHF